MPTLVIAGIKAPMRWSSHRPTVLRLSAWAVGLETITSIVRTLRLPLSPAIRWVAILYLHLVLVVWWCSIPRGPSISLVNIV